MYAIRDMEYDEYYNKYLSHPEPHNYLHLFDSRDAAEEICSILNESANNNRYEVVLVLIDGKEKLSGDQKWFGNKNPRYKDSPCTIRHGFVIVNYSKREFVCTPQTDQSGFPDAICTSYDHAAFFDTFAKASQARTICMVLDSEQEYSLGIVDIRRFGQTSKK